MGGWVVKTYQKCWLETVQDFIGLWDRFDALYLRGITADEVTDSREDEYLQFQGAMVEQLVKVVEVEHNKFDVHDLVMAVIHDAPSLRILSRQSEFQRKRLRQHWTEASDALSKLQRWCETYSPKLDRASRLQQVRRLNPFWDPAGGGFTATLLKLVIGPVTFFQGLRPGPDKKANWFLFKVLIIPLLIFFLILAIVHLEPVQQMATNFGETSGLLPEREGVVPKLLIHIFALVGIVILSLVAAAVLMLLAFLHVFTVHLMARLFGTKQNIGMTHKVIAYGAAPIVAIVTVPYAIVLQIIGAWKTLKIPPGLAPGAWLFGTVLAVLIVFGALFGTYYFTGQIPDPGQYVRVTAIGARAYERAGLGTNRVKPGDEIPSGTRLEYKGETKRKTADGSVAEFYKVTYQGNETLVPQEDGEIRQFQSSRIPLLVVELTCDKVSFVIRRLSREIGAEPD
jgi:hypothetical protein